MKKSENGTVTLVLFISSNLSSLCCPIHSGHAVPLACRQSDRPGEHQLLGTSGPRLQEKQAQKQNYF